MSVFAVIAQPSTNFEKLKQTIERVFAQNVFDLREGVWLVKTTETAVGVSNSLGISEGENGGGVVLAISADYFGRASPAVWTWLKTAFENDGRG